MYKKFNIEYILLAGILLLGFLVRLYKVNNPIADWHSWRQADTAAVTRNYVSNGINLLLPKYDDISSIQSKIFNPEGYRMVEFPFYNAISAVIAKQFPSQSLEFWSRIVTIMCAVTTAFFLYLIGKRYFNWQIGLFASFFYLFIPFNIYFTRVILPDPMGVMFGVIAIWAIGVNFYLSAIFFAMMLLIKPYLGFYLLPIIYLADFRKNWKKFILYCVIAFLPFLAWRAWESKFPEGIPLFWWAFNGNGIRFRPAYWNWVYGERLGHLILGSLGVVPFIFGLFNTKIKNYLVHWFLFGVLIYFTLVASANVMHDYYQILIMPAISLTLALGSYYLWTQEAFNQKLARWVLVFSVFVMLITGWYQIKGNYTINRYEIIEVGQEVDRTLPKDALIIAPYNGDTAFLYQTKRKGWPVVTDSMANLIEKGADYYVSVDLHSADTLNFQKQFETLKKTDKYIILDLHNPIVDL